MKKSKNKRILVVEDEPILSKALTIQLSGAGYDVSTTDNGVDGLNLIKEGTPDLVLLDLLIPDKNGIEVLKDLHDLKLTEKIPVIVLTNSGRKEDREQAMEFGVSNFFIKSETDLNDLVVLVKKIIP
jgi:two-component system alkaline phosphatase synthesis response regulator PhoP